MRKIQLGSISTGTLRTEDLLDAVIGEAGLLVPVSPTLETAYNAAVAITDYDSDDAGYALDELIDALNEYAPPHVNLGMNEGDGADFGWWPVDFDGCDTVPINQGNNGEGTFVDTECKLYVEISDHGNTTVRQLGGEIIWDCV
jgi:hypothetical protein